MLATLQTAKTWYKIPKDDTSNDADITISLLVASEAIEERCKRKFKRQTWRETLDGSGTSFLRLSQYPVESVDVLTVDNTIIDDFSIESENGILFKRSGWPCGDRIIKAEYLAGYILPSDEAGAEEATLPKTLELACVILAKSFREKKVGVDSERIGPYSVTYSKEDGGSVTLPREVEALIAPHVRR
ncbi:hypothetical protein [Paenibacillus lutimineralis]|uniref:Phage gp6-like head-tail connector protein n=1 Tax=Paenibacillus lutimineralis TaxID=2707005 RepID=A0A3S9V4P5_9BACL|nr:hypothetical protein [Paenibacillus lutimineralis]AZS17395.1 hypothetical protein EI981_25220 [Paenibacillus lutimineralis]